MSIKLGLYETIDNRFEEWLSYDAALQLYFITNDVEIYGKEIFKKSIYRAGSISVNKLNVLLKDFNAVAKKDKEELKKKYLLFIEEVCKPDKKITPEQRNDDDETTESYNKYDEYKAIKEQDYDEEINKEAETFITERIEQLEELTQDANLSDIEKYALEFLKSERKEKHTLLNNFTLNGIIQIANRGAYKLYYVKKITAS